MASCDRGHAEERFGESWLAQRPEVVPVSHLERKARGKVDEPGSYMPGHLPAVSGAGIPARRVCGDKQLPPPCE